MELCRLATLLVLCGALLGTAQAESGARAGSGKQELCLKDEVCREHYANANELYKAGKLAQAIEEYEAAYKEVQIPVFLYNLGRLHQRLGQLSQAAEHFQRYLAAGVDEDPAQRQRAQDFLREIQGQQQPAAVPAAAPVQAQAQAPIAEPKSEEKTPLYKKWWFWTATVGGVVVVGTAIGLGVGLGTHRVTVPSDLMGYMPTF